MCAGSTFHAICSQSIQVITPPLSHFHPFIPVIAPIVDAANGVAVTMGQAQDQDTGASVTSDDEIIEETEEAIDDEKDWSERVKDQWTEGKAQREARREARQQRRAERQAQDD